MAVSGKTAKFLLPYFLPGDSPPDMAAATKAISDRVEALLSKGGDVSIAADGTITIGAGKVTNSMIGSKAVGGENINDDAVGASKIAPDAVGSSEIAPDAVTGAEIAANAVGQAEIADGVVTSRKLKPTRGITSATEDMVLGANTEISGTLANHTPAVPSSLLVVATFTFQVTTLNAAGLVTGWLRVDAVDQTPVAVLSAEALKTQTVVQVYEVPLTAAAHTFRLRGAVAGGAAAKCLKTNSQLQWMVMAS